MPSFRCRRRWRPPTWEASGPRGRVLVEHPDPRVREVLTSGLQAHGYRVLTCPGPAPDATDGACPVLSGVSCPAVDGADALVVDVSDGHAAHRAVVDRIASASAARPVVVHADLRLLSQDEAIGRHRLYRTVIAPLVRRLHDHLHATPGPTQDA